MGGFVDFWRRLLGWWSSPVPDRVFRLRGDAGTQARLRGAITTTYRLRGSVGTTYRLRGDA